MAEHSVTNQKNDPDPAVMFPCGAVTLISSVALLIVGGYMVHTLAGHGDSTNLPVQVYLMTVFGVLLIAASTVMATHLWRCRRQDGQPARTGAHSARDER